MNAESWFLIVLTLCVVGPYLLGVRPKSRRDWLLIAVTLAFVLWVLPMVVRLR
jgi:hypothetical protein